MVNWIWLLVAFIGGGTAGILLMALCVAAGYWGGRSIMTDEEINKAVKQGLKILDIIEKSGNKE